MRVDVDPGGYDVAIDVEAFDGVTPVARRAWAERIPR